MGSTVTQETIAFFHIGKPLRSYKCHLQQRQYLLQYKARAKTPQKKFYFLNWYMLEPLFSAHTILLLPSPQCLQNHSSNFIESPLTFAKVKNIVKIFELELNSKIIADILKAFRFLINVIKFDYFASNSNAFREHEPADGLQPSLLLCSVQCQ